MAMNLFAGCGRNWAENARRSVDAVNDTARVLWADVRPVLLAHCTAAGQPDASRGIPLAESEAYRNCKDEWKDVAQAFAAMHMLVAAARQTLDGIRDVPLDAEPRQIRGIELTRQVMSAMVKISERVRAFLERR